MILAAKAMPVLKWPTNLAAAARMPALFHIIP
jgi:hypothetical protein